MKSKSSQTNFAPLARRDLVLSELPNEVLVYDFGTHHAHCMNQLAAQVFRCCDGRTAPSAIAVLLSEQLGTAISEAVVWSALDELDKARLLEPMLPPREQIDHRRRRAMNKLALTAGLSLALPMVWSIVAPQVAEAASQTCVPPQACMGSNPTECCGTSGMAAASCSGNGQCAGSGLLCGTCK